MSKELIDRLKLEAQMHAQEARTANATIAEIYQLCSGNKGEPGNWNGAEPVRALVAERDALAATLRQQAARVDDADVRLLMTVLSGEHGGDHADDGCDVCSAFTRIEAALSAQPAPERQGEDFEEWFTRQDSRIEWPEMVRLAYHAHPAAPVGVPAGMEPSRPKPCLPASPLGAQDFCYCNEGVSLQVVSGGGHRDGYLGRVTLKINGEWVDYVRAAPSAPQWEGPTPESMVEILWTNRGGIPTHPERK